ncbi:putative conjugative transfer protein TraI [Legionella nautarum]|uniref:Putative conjugative transfer protein TraI n=1 Tax=Legionella nautarum TaxID=45070 RepID=A0A0W0WIM3_9GAMM|nr:toprim domain-containing protein [Legionella nautarum]KTD32204.1 putative conjugative transfer protein TraI [Legionella nautarum]
MKLSRTSRLALRLGIKTKEYHDYIHANEEKERHQKRRDLFLSQPRERVINDYPELKPIYEVQDSALRFFNDVLIATPQSLNTNRRNQLRAQHLAFEAFDFLDKNKPVPLFFREGRSEEASLLRAEELRTLRHELNLSFDDNARVNSELRQEAHARYAKFSHSFFSNEQEAVKQYPELAPLMKVKKQATRYFSQWVIEEKRDKVIKDCLNRAIKDIARHIPLPNAEEIKAEALSLRSSWIGTQTNIPQAKGGAPSKTYQYQGVDFMKQLIGKNGIAQGWWPYNPDLLEATNRINDIDNEILKEQWITSFNTLPKEEVLEKFPKLTVIYNKLDAARLFYNEKIATPYAEEAAKTIVTLDFDCLLKNEPIKAISETPAKLHEQLIQQIQYQLQIEGKEKSLVTAAKPFNQQLKVFHRIQESTFNDLDASNENFPDELAPVLVPKVLELPQKPLISLESIAEQIRDLKAQMLEAGLSQQPLDKLLQEQLNLSQDPVEQELKASTDTQLFLEEKTIQPTISLSSLHSTAAPLDLDAILNSDHRSKTIEGDEFSRWDIPLLTEALNKRGREFVTALLGEPRFQDNQQLRFGANKGSLIVTIAGPKQGLWYDHQTGEGGNLIQLVQKEKNLNFKEALDYIGNYLDFSPEKSVSSQIDVSDLPKTLTDDQIKLVRYARQLANSSQPLEGTLAETYLKSRGIDTSVCSPYVRFLPSVKEKETGQMHPALLLIGKNKAGKVQCAQVTFLSKEGKKLSIEEPKRTFGLPKGALIPVHVGTSNLYGLAEGGETSLSVACAHKELTVFASLGSFTNFAHSALNGNGNTLIVFADNDLAAKASISKRNKAFEQLQAQGFNLLTCKPKTLRQDFNDVLQEKGLEGLRQESLQLTLYASEKKESTRHQENQFSRQLEKKKTPEQELDF